MSGAVILRMLKFSAVGAIGLIVQIGVLAGLSATTIKYLPATALAIECAVIHNFVWHWLFTWADRSRSGMRDFLISLFRFHVTAGLVSFVGNLLLMRLLAGSLGIPLIRANLEAIAACFVVNFLVSNYWVFSGGTDLNA